ncbi:transport and Golgi organization protein 2 isoform X2 [Trichoplusia ni]|uniref:Transport and Golgi organization protein 2 isoform X2 n=1 Tax=Trichoplusia ni TaxID=7111 RepID=A0A7E5VHR6_TRINI|nr:transport and Golgi organization protein 2 isoform X2 [Trichoplusia ni]
MNYSCNIFHRKYIPISVIKTHHQSRRDLGIEDGGAWLAVSPLRKKIGVILNLPGTNKENAKSRGKIVAEYVKGEKPVNEYVKEIKDYTKECNEFIFVSAELRSSGPSIFSYSNANDQLLPHKDTYLGFGNSLPESPLKKVEAGRSKLMEICTEYKKIKMQRELIEKLIELLKSDERHLPDQQLETRRPNLYKELSSIYVCVPQGRYGTRTHTLVLVTKTGHMNIIEITQQAPIDPANPQWLRSEFQYDIEM